jgi:hypothetical protein
LGNENETLNPEPETSEPLPREKGEAGEKE